MKRFRGTPGVILGVLAIVLALGGTAIGGTSGAGKLKGKLKLAFFEPTSRDRLAGTGVIQFAAASHTTPAVVDSPNTVHTYTVKCELSKKATSGGFKWTGAPPDYDDYKLLDAYPNGGGFVVRLQLNPGTAMDPSTAVGKPIEVYSNCVKSRLQRGTPPT